MTDLIQEIEKAIEKAIDEYAHDKIEAAGIKAGAQFILPLLKKLIEDDDRAISINHEYYGGGSDIIEMRNKSLLKLLGENHE